MIDAFRPAEGPPPRKLLAFFRWCLAGAWPGLIFAAFTSALGGIADVASAVLLGAVVDAVISTPVDQIWTRQGWLIFGFAAFFLVIRPAIVGLSTASSSVIINPNILPLVLSRSEVRALLGCQLLSPLQRLALRTLYATGMRGEELFELELLENGRLQVAGRMVAWEWAALR